MDYINILQLSDNFTKNLQLTKNVNNYVDIVEKFRDKGEIMRIVVLAGGTSTERDVSLVTGYRVCESLRRNGHEANMLDIFLGVDDSEVKTFFTEKNDLGELSDNLKKKTADIPAEVKRRTEARESFFGRNVLEKQIWYSWDFMEAMVKMVRSRLHLICLESDIQVQII